MSADYDIQVVDNFFPILIQKEIENQFLDDSICWSYLNNISSKKFVSQTQKGKILDTSGFVSSIDLEDSKNQRLINYIKHYAEKQFQVEVNKFLRLMLVYLPPNPSYPEDAYLLPHVDYKIPYKNILYYVLDNDANTIFFDQKYDKNITYNYDNFENLNVYKKVEPKKGRAVYFDGLIYHAGNVSKFNKRLTLNINFI